MLIMAAGPRDSAQTRTNILDAARGEFAHSGFAGARVDEIARIAGCDKRLIYRYFTDKAGLFTAVMHAALSHKREVLGPLQSCLGDTFETAFPSIGVNAVKSEWLRILLWEALEDNDEIVAKAERRDHVRKHTAELEALKAVGGIAPDLDANYVTLMLTALILFPWLMPQFPKIACGKGPKDPTFRKGYIATVKRVLAGGLCGAAGVDAGLACPGQMHKAPATAKELPKTVKKRAKTTRR